MTQRGCHGRREASRAGDPTSCASKQAAQIAVNRTAQSDDLFHASPPHRRLAVRRGVNAIVDALSVLGIKRLDTPCTPHRVWQAIANAGACVTTAHQHNARVIIPSLLQLPICQFS
jgi:hypothetical protein